MNIRPLSRQPTGVEPLPYEPDPYNQGRTSRRLCQGLPPQIWHPAPDTPTAPAAAGRVRFGSSHFRLAGNVLSRTTFCYPDSSTEPTHFETAARMPRIELAESDVLDDHIEAHIHGPLRLDRDVETLVLDPSSGITGFGSTSRTCNSTSRRPGRRSSDQIATE